MANLKSITELPVATSADGVNLIVNDNGYAKQIAAGAVGAQADWNVKDEANPAFVKNKPFYDTREYSGFNLTFDGDLTGKEYVDIGNNMYFVKISNQPISKEEISGATIYLFFEGQVQIQTGLVNPDMLIVDESGNITTNEFPFVVMQNSGEFNDWSLTAGVWVGCFLTDGSLVGYVSKISKTTLVGGELQKIELKYIPEPEYDVDCVATLLSIDENGNQEWDYNIKQHISFSDIVAKMKAGIAPKGRITIDVMTNAEAAGIEYPVIQTFECHDWEYWSTYGNICWNTCSDGRCNFYLCVYQDNSLDIEASISL